MLLDANALMMPFQFSINLDAEMRRLLGDVDAAVPRPVLEELHRLATGNRFARAAERLATRYRTIESAGSADESLLALASSLSAIVVTNDLPLLETLRKAGIPRISLRSRNHLVLEGV